MPRHLSRAEIERLDKMLEKGKSAQQMLVALQKSRARAGSSGPTKSTIYSWRGGKTHKLGAKEKRRELAV